MGLPVVTVTAGGLPIVESTVGGTPVTEATNGYGVPVTKVVGKPGMPVVFETIGVAPAFATLDPATLSDAALSNGNLTATHVVGTTNTGARGIPAANSGKYYFEIINVSGGAASDCLGLVTTTGTYANVIATLNCVAAFRSNGGIASNNANSGKTIGAGGVGSVTGVAVDLTVRRAWMRRGAGNWNGLAIGSENPATGLGGVTVAPTVSFIPVVAFSSSAGGDTYTFNFGATAYANAAPAGFGNWPA